MPTFRDQLAQRLLGPYIEARIAAAQAPLQDTITALQGELERARLAAAEDAFARAGTAPGLDRQDKTWSLRQQDLDDALAAWAINPYARRIVNLVTAHVIGRSLVLASGHPDINAWINAWWSANRNRLTTEIYAWCDELTRAGELFLRLTTHPTDGSQTVRAIPARWINEVVTDPDDYRCELTYHDEANDITTAAYQPDADPGRPAMLHHAINRPVGAVRSWGGDLDPVLPSLDRYMTWLRGRVAINTSRGNWAWSMQAASAARVAELEEKYRGGVIPTGAIFVHTPDEKLEATSPQINAADARDDGVALRQAIAVGANLAPFLLGDEFSTRAQAREAALPVLQNFATRQVFFGAILQDVAQAAVTRAYDSRKWRRKNGARLPADFSWSLSFSDLTRDDNQVLAQSALTIVNALSIMRERGWIDDETAISWAAKFAGETLSEKLIQRRLDHPPDADQVAADEQTAAEGTATHPLMNR